MRDRDLCASILHICMLIRFVFNATQIGFFNATNMYAY